MAEERVHFSIGPVPSKTVLAWSAHARRMIETVAANPELHSISVHPDTVDFADTLLMAWEGIAQHAPVFEWSFETSAHLVESVIELWLQIGALTDDELDRLGLTWAPEATRPMSDALVDAVAGILPQLGHESRRRFIDRLEQGS